MTAEPSQPSSIISFRIRINCSDPIDMWVCLITLEARRRGLGDAKYDSFSAAAVASSSLVDSVVLLSEVSSNHRRA